MIYNFVVKIAWLTSTNVLSSSVLLIEGFGQLNQSSTLSSTLNSGLNSSINISSAMGAGSYQHYGLNALGEISTN